MKWPLHFLAAHCHFPWYDGRAAICCTSLYRALGNRKRHPEVHSVYAINLSDWTPYIIAALIVFILILGAIGIKFGMLWIQAMTSGAYVGLLDLIGMSLRKVPPRPIVEACITCKQARNLLRFHRAAFYFKRSSPGPWLSVNHKVIRAENQGVGGYDKGIFCVKFNDFIKNNSRSDALYGRSDGLYSRSDALYGRSEG